MKKTILFTLVLFAIVQISIVAQKPIKQKLAPYSYTQLPSIPLPEGYKTYTVNAESFNKHREDKIKRSFYIPGYKKVSESDADFKISIKEYEVQLGKPELKIETKKKKVDGVEKTYKKYFYTFNVKHKMKASVYNNEDEEITNKEIDENSAYNSEKVYSHKEAYDKYKSYISSLSSTLLSSKANSLASELINQIGFPAKKKHIILFTVKPKKHDYDDFEQAYESFLKGYEIVEMNEDDIEKAKPAFASAQEFWTTALEESDITNKKARINKKVTAAAYYNLGVSMYLLKEYDKALEYMNSCNEASKEFADASSFIRHIENRKHRAEKNK